MKRYQKKQQAAMVAGQPLNLYRRITRKLHDANFSNRFVDLNLPVTLSSAVFVIVFITLVLLNVNTSAAFFASMLKGLADAGGWYLVLAVNVMIFASLYFAFSPYGEIRIGGELARPEFKVFSWFAMLLAAGMGIGLLFYGISEPLSHAFVLPSYSAVIPGSQAAYQQSLSFTYLHWGIGAWSIYSISAIALGFFCYNRRLPLSMRSIFYPLLGRRILGWPGHLIDILAVIATLFGLATSLGLGANQISAGLAYLFPWLGDSPVLTVAVIIVITLTATLSVVSGLGKGIRILSEANIFVFLLLLLAILFLGPTLFALDTFVQTTGTHLQQFLSLSFWLERFSTGDGEWQSNWTIFYWAWWFSWAPFVGTFIARISFGRTIREMVVGILIGPVVFCYFWFGTAGGTAIWLQQNGVEIYQSVQENIATGFFSFLTALLESHSFSALAMKIVSPILLGLTLIVIVIFFITSSDSGSMVVDMLTSGGKQDSPVLQKIFWAFTEGALAIVLLLGGGLVALQSSAVVTGLPFSLFLVVAVFSLRRGLRRELLQIHDEVPETLFTTEHHTDDEIFQGPEDILET